MTDPCRWHKSSYSGQESDCVEVAQTLDLVRDSKNPEGPMLRVTLRPLLTAIKEDRLRG